MKTNIIGWLYIIISPILLVFAALFFASGVQKDSQQLIIGIVTVVNFSRDCESD